MSDEKPDLSEFGSHIQFPEGEREVNDDRADWDVTHNDALRDLIETWRETDAVPMQHCADKLEEVINNE